jgi:hypothetical protein
MLGSLCPASRIDSHRHEDLPLASADAALIPLYGLSLGFDASEIGILVGARSIRR